MSIWPPSLVTELAERRAVIFIGAGISKAAKSEMPSWPKLLTDMSAHITTKKDKKLTDKLIKNGRLLDAAELISSLVLPADRRSILENQFKIKPEPISEIYSDILSLDQKICITTNYDQFIEKNFEHFSGTGVSHQVRLYTYKKILSDIRSPSRILIKLHGCISDPPDIVLDKRSYFKAKSENPGIYETIKALCTLNTVLFLGYSMNDPDIQLILEDINAVSSTEHRHFALVPKFEHPSLREANSQTYNINFIEYANGRHDLVPKYINELRSSVESTRASYGTRI
ncbi:SIR2 family protein [Novosphingobium profundi]|uniref:SIR2 family protein n=1 Tax=Novosphingobium profundi TaxID=1774954 RepID=UPI001CFC83D0|nr:SIR2 family protein [Novosphingobium profundi]